MLINARSSNCLCSEGQSQDRAWPAHDPVLTSAFPSPAWSVGVEPAMYKLWPVGQTPPAACCCESSFIETQLYSLAYVCLCLLLCEDGRAEQL